MSDDTPKNYNAKVKKLPQSMLEITAAIPADEFDATRSEAIKHIGADAELPGFRKGHVPEKVLVAKLGEAAILEEMAEIAIGKAYPSIVIGEKLDVLGRPQVRLTKIALGNPLEFVLTTAIFPEIGLPDYKKLAAKEARKKEETHVTDEDVDKAIENVRKMRGEHGSSQEEQQEGGEKKSLPPLTDEEVKTLGNFASVDEFKAKLKENMLKEKEREAKDKKRVALMEAIIGNAKIDLPEIVIGEEAARLEDEFAHDIERMGLTMDAYLKAIGKTKEEMRKEWRPDAEKRAKVQLAIGKIAEVEKIEPEKEKLDAEVKALRERYPDTPPERVESYVHMLLANEKVFQFLESQE